MINDVDSERFRAAGAPRDEYRAEAEGFTERLERGETLTPELVVEVATPGHRRRLDPASGNRWVLNRFARRLSDLAPDW